MQKSIAGETTLKAKRASVNPPKRMMRSMERDAEARIARALNKMRLDLLRGLTADNAFLLPHKFENQDIQQPFHDVMVSVLQDVALAGAEFGQEQVERFVFGTQKRLPTIADVISISWELVNVAAEEWARRHATDLILVMGRTTRRRIQKEVSQWVSNSETINQLANRLSRPNGPFSPKRAKRIAVTEVTRAFAEGNTEAWKEAGVVEGRRWNTNVDERVCPLCGPLHNEVVGIDENFSDGTKNPPRHVNCRCWLTPTVEGVEEREVGLSLEG